MIPTPWRLYKRLFSSHIGRNLDDTAQGFEYTKVSYFMGSRIVCSAPPASPFIIYTLALAEVQGAPGYLVYLLYTYSEYSYSRSGFGFLLLQ